ncbi:MAG: choice-of-anchor V domain-containing protein [Lewinella sp.]
MKKRLPPFLLALSILLAGYSSGPASSDGQGYTGAPSAGGGTEGNCGTCHNSGDYGTPQIEARFDGMDDLTYRPGQTYTVTVSVQSEFGQPVGYGFQAQFLDSTDPILQPAGVLSDPDDATQIATVNNGRSYAEHKGPNADSLFSFNWTAPPIGTGTVSMYLVGNTVNRAAGSGGDNGSREPLILSLTEGEEVSTSLAGSPTALLAGSAYPNPTTDQAVVPIDVPATGRYRFDLISPDGKTIATSTQQLFPGAQSVTVDLRSRAAGIYHYRISGPTGSETVRLHRQ